MAEKGSVLGINQHLVIIAIHENMCCIHTQDPQVILLTEATNVYPNRNTLI